MALGVSELTHRAVPAVGLWGQQLVLRPGAKSGELGPFRFVETAQLVCPIQEGFG